MVIQPIPEKRLGVPFEPFPGRCAPQPGLWVENGKGKGIRLSLDILWEPGSSMKKTLHLIALAAVLLGLPITGVWLVGADLSTYLEFPPRTRYVRHAAFSWPVFIVLALVILAVILPFLIRLSRSRSPDATPPARRSAPVVPFPWWGWLSLVLGFACWLLAWTRFTWFAPFQRYTFSPQWLCYMVLLNALTYRRTGQCLMTRETSFFLKLFLFSAAFWWFFEYLNRFVQNWYYVGCEQFTPLQYFMVATLPFSTVLPAVLSTEEWLSNHRGRYAGLEHFIPIRWRRPKTTAWLALAVSVAGLFFIGQYPDQLFPLLWTAPLLLLIAFRAIANRTPVFHEIEGGDWRRAFRFCLAALICGFFWEMWNVGSLAKWIYAIPYVHRFQLFEMPILGYAGYLPFGLECAVVAQMIRGRRS
jgi:hypothetical protein